MLRGDIAPPTRIATGLCKGRTIPDPPLPLHSAETSAGDRRGGSEVLIDDDEREEFQQTGLWKWLDARLSSANAGSGIRFVVETIFFCFYKQLVERGVDMTDSQDGRWQALTEWAVSEYLRLRRHDIARIFRQYLLGTAYYPAPTAIERIQHTFGETEPVEMKTYDPYISSIQRHYIYSGVFKKAVSIQLSLPGLQAKDDLDKIDRMILESTDALALKVFHAIFAECYRQSGKWLSSCYWDANTFCDLLGYKRDKRGYHYTNNIEQVEKRIKILSELTYRFEFLGYDPKTEADRIVFEGPLITIEPRQTVSLFKREARIAKKSTLRIHDELYRNMTERKMFAWFDSKFLRLHPRRQSRAILLYSYYVCQLAMGMKQRKGPKNVIKRPIDTVLRETGIKIDCHHKKRDIELLIRAHEELKQRGLIQSFVIEWLNNNIEIMFYENHPVLGKNKRKQLSNEVDDWQNL